MYEFIIAIRTDDVSWVKGIINHLLNQAATTQAIPATYRIANDETGSEAFLSVNRSDITDLPDSPIN